VSSALLILAAIGDSVSADDVAFTLMYLAPVALATQASSRGWWPSRRGP
jgi:hypothetical protein